MKLIQDNGVMPVIEATDAELVKIASAAMGAVTHQEAVVFHYAKAQVGFRLVEDGCPCVGTSEQEHCPHE